VPLLGSIEGDAKRKYFLLGGRERKFSGIQPPVDNGMRDNVED
jgi:hypothetical protein